MLSRKLVRRNLLLAAFALATTVIELLSKVVDESRSSSGEFLSIFEDCSCNHGGQQRAAVEFSPVVLS